MSKIEEDIRKSLFAWYDFRKESKVLLICSGEDYSIPTKCIMRKTVTIEKLKDEKWLTENLHIYNYVILSPILELEKTPWEILEKCIMLLKKEGTILLALNNRLGLRYFCGDRDIYTQRNFDGIENYYQTYSNSNDIFRGRMYSKAEIKKFLEMAQIKKYKFYSVISDLENPVLIYSEDYLPNEDLSIRVFPTYNYPETVFLREEYIYNSLVENNMFHQTANAYIVECCLEGELSDILHITNSIERGRENALLTIIRKDSVEKKPLYDEGMEKLRILQQNNKKMREMNIKTVDSVIENGKYITPYIKAETGQAYLKRILNEDKEKFLKEMDHFCELILDSSEKLSEDKKDGNGVILKNGFFDMIPLNSFYINGDFVFYDQEFCMENYPANVIIWRMVVTVCGLPSINNVVTLDEMLERYDLKNKQSKWEMMSREFIQRLRKEKELDGYHGVCRRDNETVNINRQRINYNEYEYKTIFQDVFKDIESKKIILFGSGYFGSYFMEIYSEKYPVYAIVDNNPKKWGTSIKETKIYSPKILEELNKDDIKVIICMKNYLPVMYQLHQMGIKNLSIFDRGRLYDDNQPDIKIISEQIDKNKKYHIGYVAGVFDMFHVGHVNLLRKAKEMCDHLIVGVVPDDEVYLRKHKYPVIPCDERVEILKACKYTDQVEVLNGTFSDIRTAYRLFKFDCMFSGDDHGKEWQSVKNFLKKYGADIVFFPYTQKTSSTLIRSKLNESDSNSNRNILDK